MRRKKDDKRVLFSPNSNRPKHSNKRKLNLPQFQRKPQRSHKHSKWGNVTVFLIILALVAFVVGAGIGVSLSFDNDDGPHWENVTEETTTNLSETDNVTYDEEVDGVDFNSNETLTELNVSAEPSY